MISSPKFFSTSTMYLITLDFDFVHPEIAV